MPTFPFIVSITKRQISKALCEGIRGFREKHFYGKRVFLQFFDNFQVIFLQLLKCRDVI